MSSTSEEVDRLRSLPEEVLSHILSVMPMKSAVRTSILSKRWRYRWTSVTNLDFDDIHPIHGLQCLSEFVDRVLKLCKTSQVQLFRLHFLHVWVRNSSLSKWISEAVRLNVRELDIQVVLLELPLSLFTCKTLATLRLVQGTHDWGVWNWPYPINLPCLKTLDIVVSSKPSVNAFKLISGCPVLESLSLDIVWRENGEEYNFNIPTLKRLKLTLLKCVNVINKVIINAPNLEYLYVGGILCSLFVIKDLSFPVEATVSFFEVRYSHLLVELIRGISGAKSLSWSGSTTEAPFNLTLPKFPNLKRLELKCHFNSGWLLIPQFLESSSELEHLCIEEFEVKLKLEDSCWIKPQSVPTCMLTNLRTMKFAICKGRKHDLQFLQYMLANAEVLKTLTITCKSLSLKEEMQLCTQLLKFPTASRYCEIHFVGNHMSTL